LPAGLPDYHHLTTTTTTIITTQPVVHQSPRKKWLADIIPKI
jgi:hypothetical protein